MAVEAAGHGATERVAGDEVCSVYRCPCGCVHVHVGAFTVRLAPEAFRELASVLGAAAAALDGAQAPLRSH
jgi:hypothetical protein